MNIWAVLGLKNQPNNSVQAMLLKILSGMIVFKTLNCLFRSYNRSKLDKTRVEAEMEEAILLVDHQKNCSK